MEHELILRNKVVIIGDSAVGKTALCKSFVSNGSEFSKNYVMTPGCEVSTRAVKVPETKNATVELYLFDTSGQSIYKEMFSSIWEGASSVMVVYDVTREETFRNCNIWLDMLKKSRPERKFPGLVVANKIDLEDRIAVHAGQGASFAEENDLVFFQCSAASNTDVDAPFNFLASAFYKDYEEKLAQLESLL